MMALFLARVESSLQFDKVFEGWCNDVPVPSVSLPYSHKGDRPERHNYSIF